MTAGGALDPRAWPGALRQGMERWQQERPWRERLIVLLAAAMLVLAAVDRLLNLPLEHRLKQARAQAQARQAELQALQRKEGPRSDAQALREQAQLLQRRLDAAQQALALLQGRARDAARLPQTLQVIAGTVDSVRLLGLDLSGDVAEAGARAVPSPEAGPAMPPASDAAAVPVTAGLPLSSTRLYRLPITLKVGGAYAELQTLLTRIEEQAPALNWTRLTLDAAAWPAIAMTLQAHVASPHARWGASP